MSEEQILAWNKFTEKCGWRDEDEGSTQEIEAYKAASGLSRRIDFVFFDANSLGQPEFDIQVRAPRNEPDYFYLNQNLRMVKGELL